jgi:hypothetical protein
MVKLPFNILERLINKCTFFSRTCGYLLKLVSDVHLNFSPKLALYRPNNLEDLRQRIRPEMEPSPDIIERSVQISVSAKWLAGENLYICIELYC